MKLLRKLGVILLVTQIILVVGLYKGAVASKLSIEYNKYNLARETYAGFFPFPYIDLHGTTTSFHWNTTDWTHSVEFKKKIVGV
ncbi:MAG: hypothetical protein GF384_04405 [Elusimicrobia bacterium]|nr:hypothetical protein [Elusimicrobiota bacterium]